MGEEEAVTEATGVVENGTVPPEKDGESATEKKEEVQDGVKEMEEDCKHEEKVGSTKMDVDKSEAKEINEGKTKEETEFKGSSEEEKDKGKEEGEHKSEAMDEENMIEEEENVIEEEEIVNEESEDKVENAAGLKVAEEKVSKKHRKTKTTGENVNNKKKAVEEKKEKEQKTPVTPAIERPVRERKSVERLVATIERDAVKEFHIGKGRGTALKDIPNVAYKLSKKKSDETCRLLHSILYGRRGKAPQVKTNISRFSGFVWHENEDKQKIKVQEKFDKFVKEKLLEFCDVLDLPIAKATTRKEDIVTKLIDFLVAPYATTTELLTEKEKSIKGKKRKRPSKNSSSTSGSTPSRNSLKLNLQSRKRIENASKEEEKSSKTDPEEEYEEEHEDGDEDGHVEQENVNGVPEGSEDVKPEYAKSEEKETESEAESEEDTQKCKQGSKKLSAKNSSEKAKTKKIATPKKSSSPPKKAHSKSSSSRSKVEENNDTSPKTFLRKKTKEKVNQKSTTPKKNVSKEKTGKKAVIGKENPKEEKLRPSGNELKNAICEILKEVDFNTATCTDILKLLAKRFSTDLTPRKSSIKLMIQDELTKLADEEEGDDVRDEKHCSDRGVKA